MRADLFKGTSHTCGCMCVRAHKCVPFEARVPFEAPPSPHSLQPVQDAQLTDPSSQVLSPVSGASELFFAERKSKQAYRGHRWALSASQPPKYANSGSSLSSVSSVSSASSAPPSIRPSRPSRPSHLSRPPLRPSVRLVRLSVRLYRASRLVSSRLVSSRLVWSRLASPRLVSPSLASPRLAA